MNHFSYAATNIEADRSFDSEAGDTQDWMVALKVDTS